MANSSLLVTQGSQAPIAQDSVSGTYYQTVKLDVGGAGVSVPFTGSLTNVGSITNIGTLPALTIGTVPGIGSITNLGSQTALGTASGIGTLTNVGSVSNVGSISAIGGIVQVQGASVGTYVNISTGTVNSVGNVVQVGTVLGIGGIVQVQGASAGTTIQVAGGTVASGAADGGNPVKIGGVYNASAPSLTSGNRGDLQLDINANAKVTMATLIAGEMLSIGTTGVLRIENQFTGSYMAAAGTYILSSGTGVVHTLTIGATTAAAGTLYNSAGTSSTLLWSHKASVAEQTFTLDVAYSSGLTYANPGTPQVMISFR